MTPRAPNLAPIAVLLALALIYHQGACAEGLVRYHGFKMDDQRRLVIEQEDGVIRIGILTRDRDEGGPHLDKVTATSPPRAVTEFNPFRSAKKETLLEVRAETLQAAAPNALKNPAQRYRITIHGLQFEPDYARVIETGAANARAAFFKEFETLEARANGVYREALHQAAPLTLGALSEAGLMPAELPETIRRSAVAQTRLNADLQRKSMDTGRSLEPAAHPAPAPNAPKTATR